MTCDLIFPEARESCHCSGISLLPPGNH